MAASPAEVDLRPARVEDLPAINAVVEAAVMTWKLPDRVKRLALPGYRYSPLDLAHLDMLVADMDGAGIVGVAGLEPAEPGDPPAGCTGLLLHGLYVHPHHQRRGIGAGLLAVALARVARAGRDGLLVKAQADAAGFFIAQGMTPLPVNDPERDYPYRFWGGAPS